MDTHSSRDGTKKSGRGDWRGVEKDYWDGYSRLVTQSKGAVCASFILRQTAEKKKKDETPQGLGFGTTSFTLIETFHQLEKFLRNASLLLLSYPPNAIPRRALFFLFVLPFSMNFRISEEVWNVMMKWIVDMVITEEKLKSNSKC